MTDELVELSRRHCRAVVLCLLGGCTEVGDRYDAVNADRFLGREVGDVGCDLARGDRRLQISGIDKIGTRKVDDANAVLHYSKALFRDHVLRRLGCGNVEGDIIGNLEDLLKGRRLVYAVVDVPCRINAEEGIASDDVHAEMNCRVCNETADRTETDDTEGLACKLVAAELRLALLDRLCDVLGEGLCPCRALDDLTRGEHQSADRKLLNGVCICTGGVEYDNTLLRATIDRDIVDACACTGDREKVIAEFHIVHCGGADENAVGLLAFVNDVVFVFVKLIKADGRDLIQTKDVFHETVPL